MRDRKIKPGFESVWTDKRRGSNILHGLVQQQVPVADIKPFDNLLPSLQTHRETDTLIDPVGKISCGVIREVPIDHPLPAALQTKLNGFRRPEPSVWHKSHAWLEASENFRYSEYFQVRTSSS
ncbi:hypothetical protein [Rhizobium sp. AN80A]|uniref:hypothetical protein n=1 Tax=Rhizobium sp. AN80A TaxID=3040673 RepID=UPI0024B3A224|nr:hypothetical protein [Rhizobium sp. AN80A]